MTGDWHKRVPRDLKQNLAFRKHILEAAVNDRAIQQGLLEICARDILFWINTFVWTVDPRKRRRAAFITWPAQERALVGGIDPWSGERVYGLTECMNDGKDVQIEKSRDEGGTLLCLFSFLHPFLNGSDFYEFLVTSRNEKMVTGKSPKSLFQKIKFTLDFLPDWMKQGVSRLDDIFENERNEATINGEATTKKIAVGDRPTGILLDEFSQMEQAREIYDRTNDSTDCRIFNYTHTGPGTMAAELSGRSDVRKIVLHWSDDPRKSAGLYRVADGKVEILDKSYRFPPDYRYDMSGRPGGARPGVRSPWYDEQCVRRGSMRSIAMDLDIDPFGSSKQVYDAGQIKSLIRDVCVPPLWEGYLDFDEATAKPKTLVQQRHGPLKLWIIPRDGKPPVGTYGIGGDISEGRGATPSCASIGDCTLGEKVGHFTDATMPPYRFAAFMVALCRLFANEQGYGARLAWEQQGPAGHFASKIDDLGYGDVYESEDNSKSWIDRTRSKKPGWYPSEKNKVILHLSYAEALYRGFYTNRSERSMTESLGYIYVPNRAGRDTIDFPTQKNEDKTEEIVGIHGENLAGRDCHGDLVVADALVWMLAKQSGLPRLRLVANDDDEPQEIRPNTLAWRKQMNDDARREAVWVK